MSTETTKTVDLTELLASRAKRAADKTKRKQTPKQIEQTKDSQIATRTAHFALRELHPLDWERIHGQAKALVQQEKAKA